MWLRSEPVPIPTEYINLFVHFIHACTGKDGWNLVPDGFFVNMRIHNYNCKHQIVENCRWHNLELYVANLIPKEVSCFKMRQVSIWIFWVDCFALFSLLSKALWRTISSGSQGVNSIYLQYYQPIHHSMFHQKTGSYPFLTLICDQINVSVPSIIITVWWNYCTVLLFELSWSFVMLSSIIQVCNRTAGTL